MRKLGSIALGLFAFAGGACGFGLGSDESQVAGDDVDGPDDGGDGGPAGGSCSAGEPDLPYDVKIQCGDAVIPVVAAFREENGPGARFAPAPGTSPDCPFLIEGAVIRADEVASCAPFVATAEDARAEGNRDAGRDRVEVTWCWYATLDVDHETGDCCVPPEGVESIQCATDHLDIRFSCDGGEGVPDGADEPLEPAATPDVCVCDTDEDGVPDPEDPDDDGDGNPDDTDDCDADPDPCGGDGGDGPVD